MKKVILAPILLFVCTFWAIAQNRSIVFEESRVWNEIVAKAKNEKKLIFVDCYTDWCGPCKQLAANVFTQDKVADFFNEKFVNAKFEMEKDADGIANKNVWKISAYPTLIFVDPNSGAVVHRLVGAGRAEWLIEGGNVALDPMRNLNSMIERYNNGERSPEFVIGYLRTLKAAYMHDLQGEVAAAYLKDLTIDRLATTDNWLVIRDNITDPLSQPMRLVMEGRQKFYDIEGLGKESVDRFLTSSLDNAAVTLARTGLNHSNRSRFDELYSYLQSIDYPAKAHAITWLETSVFVRNSDWLGLARRIEELEGSNMITSTQYQFFIETFGNAKEPAMVDWAIEHLNAKIAGVSGENTDAWYRKAGYAESKQRILQKAGRELAADNALLEKQDYEKKGEEASGGRMTRAIRMM